MKNIFLKSSLTCILIFLVSCSSESTSELNVLDESLNLEKAQIIKLKKAPSKTPTLP